MKQTVLGVLVLLQIVQRVLEVAAHRCDHGKHKDHKPPVPLDDTPQTRSRLLEVGGSSNYLSWHYMRIGMDWSSVANYSNANPARRAQTQLMVRVVHGATGYFEKILQVDYYAQMNLPGGLCGSTDLDPMSVPYDLFILVNPAPSESASYITRSVSCFYSSKDGRPLVAALFLNPTYMTDTPSQELKVFFSVLHEMIHMLGFDNDLFGNFKIPGTNTTRELTQVIKDCKLGENNYQCIILPEVVTWARNHFGCTTLWGVPLENYGGFGVAGHHWESTFFFSELMAPTVDSQSFLSGLTHAFLRGTGWYNVLESSDQVFEWSANTGCSCYDLTCPAIPEQYCSPTASSSNICGPNFYAKGSCVKQSELESARDCRVLVANENSCFERDYSTLSNETFGAGSRCFNTKKQNFARAQCFVSTCLSSGTVVITVGTKNYSCTTTGQQITIAVGEIVTCPNVAKLCGHLRNSCPQDCNRRGYCARDKTCYCLGGWSGLSCGFSSQMDYSKFLVPPTTDKKHSFILRWMRILPILLIIHLL